MSLEKSRSTSNTIFRINDGNNDLTHYDEILTFIAEYYENIYKSPSQRSPVSESNKARDTVLNPNNVNKLDDNEVELSDTIISEAELLDTLKSMKNGSSPWTRWTAHRGVQGSLERY